MLSESQRDRLNIVLVSPRNPLNIGAAARAMANFGFAQLAVVAPYEEHWREAKSAVQAEDLLQNARCTQCLAEAVVECTLVVGTGTIGHRRPEQTVISLPDLMPFVDTELARGGRVALVFGSEKRGLTREDFALCHMLVEIPTDSRQPSMNLGQAVAVCLYELAARRNPPANPAEETRTELSSSHSGRGDAAAASMRDLACAGDLELLAGVVAEAMQAAHYTPAAMQKANDYDLHLLLRRLALTRPDARRILGLFRRILWRLKHPGGVRN